MKKEYTEEELILMAMNDRLRSIDSKLDVIMFGAAVATVVVILRVMVKILT